MWDEIVITLMSFGNIHEIIVKLELSSTIGALACLALRQASAFSIRLKSGLKDGRCRRDGLRAQSSRALERWWIERLSMITTPPGVRAGPVQVQPIVVDWSVDRHWRDYRAHRRPSDSVASSIMRRHRASLPVASRCGRPCYVRQVGV